MSIYLFDWFTVTRNTDISNRVKGNWRQIEAGMPESDVIRLLGPPLTSGSARDVPYSFVEGEIAVDIEGAQKTVPIFLQFDRHGKVNGVRTRLGPMTEFNARNIQRRFIGMSVHRAVSQMVRITKRGEPSAPLQYFVYSKGHDSFRDFILYAVHFNADSKVCRTSMQRTD